MPAADAMADARLQVAALAAHSRGLVRGHHVCSWTSIDDEGQVKAMCVGVATGELKGG